MWNRLGIKKYIYILYMYTFYGNNLRGERKKKNNNKESPIFPLIYFGLAR